MGGVQLKTSRAERDMVGYKTKSSIMVMVVNKPCGEVPRMSNGGITGGKFVCLPDTNALAKSHRFLTTNLLACDAMRCQSFAVKSQMCVPTTFDGMYVHANANWWCQDDTKCKHDKEHEAIISDGTIRIR